MKIIILYFPAFLFVFFNFASFQTVMAQDEKKIPAPKPDAVRQLTAEEKNLVAGSKSIIIKSGISEDYFDKHFRLEKVFSVPSNQRVVWKYTVGEYEVFVNDAVGYYTDKENKRVFTHSVGNLLPRSHDIKTTISKKRAGELMKQCIGEYTSENISFQTYGSPPRAALVMVALSDPKPVEETEEEKKLKQEFEKAASKKEKLQADTIREGGKKKPIIYTGIINLETGECVKGRASAGANPPFQN